MTTISVARLIVTASLFVSPVAAFAQDNANQQPAANSATADAAPKPAAVEDKKICKQLPSSSSRLPQRVCLTAKEWQQVDEDSQ